MRCAPRSGPEGCTRCAARCCVQPLGRRSSKRSCNLAWTARKVVRALGGHFEAFIRRTLDDPLDVEVGCVQVCLHLVRCKEEEVQIDWLSPPFFHVADFCTDVE